MTEPEEVKPRRRRTRQEVQRLVGEFGTSGQSRGEFCRIRGMTLSTLQRGLMRERTEPSDIQSGGKRLLRVKVLDQTPFCFAGLWEGWKKPGTEDWFRACTIITCEANEFMAQIHSRMPV